MNNKKRVLIIEDDTDLNFAYCTVLEREGFEVATVKDGFEALDTLKKFIPDIILLDLRMPKMGGIEFLQQAEINERFPQTRVIVFTNFDLNEEIQQAFDLGANRYVLKATVSPKELTKIITDELES